VGVEQCQVPADLAGAFSRLGFICVFPEKGLADIPVAKAVDGELATMNGPAATASWPGASVVLI